MAQTASVRLTLNNLATSEQIEQMEERIMSALSDAIAALRTQVENLTVAQSPEKVAELEAAVQREREANEALVAKAVEVASAEELEDTQQAQELADAKAANDALIAEMNAAAGDLGGITAQLAAVGTAVDDAPDETPVGEVPVPEPEPAPVGGADGPLPPTGDTTEPAPADGGATPGEGSTPDPSSPATPDAGVSPDGGAPAEAGAPDAGAPAPTTGPTDSSGNPIDGPNI
jgi:hypothetical protein